MFSPLERRQPLSAAAHHGHVERRRDDRILNKAARYCRGTQLRTAASPEKGITMCCKGTHQPLMPRQGGGSARSASSFVFNWDKMASSGSLVSFPGSFTYVCVCGVVVPLGRPPRKPRCRPLTSTMGDKTLLLPVEFVLIYIMQGYLLSCEAATSG